MKIRLSILRWSILVFSLLLGLVPTVAYASDCPPDDPSRSDCKGAASTARSPLVPIAGAVAGGMAGWVIGQALDPTTGTDEDKEKENESKVDPCRADLNRYAEASMRARVFQTAREGQQKLLNLLETMYEDARQAGFWSTSLDVAFLAGSMWTKPVAGLLGKELVDQTLGQKLFEAVVKTFGQELTKSLFTAMDQQGIDWSQAALKAPAKSFYETGLQEMATKLLVEQHMEVFAIHGIKPGGPVAQALERSVANDVVSPYFEGMFGVKALYESMKGGWESIGKMREIQAQISTVHKNLLDANAQFDEALEDMTLARSTLEHCRRIWAQK
jgi:hypothetical protein